MSTFTLVTGLRLRCWKHTDRKSHGGEKETIQSVTSLQEKRQQQSCLIIKMLKHLPSQHGLKFQECNESDTLCTSAAASQRGSMFVTEDDIIML